jgi:hypothetical protein
MSADLLVQDEGSLVLLIPVGMGVSQWLEAVTPAESLWFGGGLVCEPRYVGDILAGALEAGFTVGRAA